MVLDPSGAGSCETSVMERIGVKLVIFCILVSWGVRAF